MHRQLVAQQMATAGRLDGIEIADQVGDGDVGRGQLLDESGVARKPPDRRRVAPLLDQLAGVLRDRGKGIVVDLAAGDDRNRGVEESDQVAKDSALGLPAEAEENEVLLGEEGVDDLGDDGIVVPSNPRKERLASPQRREQVGPDLLPYRSVAPLGLAPFFATVSTPGRPCKCASTAASGPCTSR